VDRKNIKIIVHRSASNIIRLDFPGRCRRKTFTRIACEGVGGLGDSGSRGEERGSSGEKEIRVWVRDPNS